jgi:hypothetical protein
MAGSGSNTLRAVLRELGWSRTRLVAGLRRQAASSGESLPGTESLLAMVSRWVNNHQQPSNFYRDLLARTLGRPRAELFSDEAARLMSVARTGLPHTRRTPTAQDAAATATLPRPRSPAAAARTRPHCGRRERQRPAARQPQSGPRAGRPRARHRHPPGGPRGGGRGRDQQTPRL